MNSSNSPSKSDISLHTEQSHGKTVIPEDCDTTSLIKDEYPFTDDKTWDAGDQPFADEDTVVDAEPPFDREDAADHFATDIADPDTVAYFDAEVLQPDPPEPRSEGHRASDFFKRADPLLSVILAARRVASQGLAGRPLTLIAISELNSLVQSEPMPHCVTAEAFWHADDCYRIAVRTASVDAPPDQRVYHFLAKATESEGSLRLQP